MKITEDLLETMYNRVIQYANTKYGTEPSEVELFEGLFYIHYYTYYCGNRDVKTYAITADCLTKNLDVVYKERKQQEEITRLKEKKNKKNYLILEKLQKKRKEKFNLKNFHENLISYESYNVRRYFRLDVYN